jgi:membrane protease YdiL (CAAX protease family)
MPQASSFLKRHSLVIWILLAFALTWPIDLANAGLLPFQVPFAVAIFVGYGFVIASLVMTGITLGMKGVIGLLKRFLIWRVRWQWYLVAVLLIPLLQLTSVFLNAALSQTPIDFGSVYAYKIFGPSVDLVLLIVPFFLFDAVANGEEIGWRGYVLPRLQAKHSALASSLILGVVWGLWHLPKYLSHWDLVSFLFFLVAILARAVLYTWLYNNTKGSVLLTTLFHASGNTGGILLPLVLTTADRDIYTLVIQTLIEVAAAIVVTTIAGPAQLSRTESAQVQTSRSATPV